MISEIARTATGKIRCFSQSIVASQLPGGRSALIMPEVGSQPSFTEKAMIIIKPSQNAGTE